MNVHKTVMILAAAGLLFGGLVGCSDAMQTNGQEETSEDDGERRIVPPGKADNYWSNVSREFELAGSIPVDMTEEEFNDEAVRNEKISERTTAVGLYLTAYLTAKLDDLFDNTDYGGFKAMVRNYSVEREDIYSNAEGEHVVDFTIDVAGPEDLLARLERGGAETTEDGVAIDLKMPKGATSNPEFVDRNVPRDFDPSEHDGELETVTLEASPLPNHTDSYPHYESFIEDGVYDITVVFGHDYNDDRWDIITAEEVFDWLVDAGFESPVQSFDDLGASSGAFTKTFEAPEVGGVDMQVRLLHADMFEGERDRHKERVIEALRERDVFYYWGHAGPYYGFSLSPNDKADLGYQEIEELDLKDKQQLVIASGCQTYSQYADMLYANPAKSEENLDVITTVNYSNLAAGDAILPGLVDVADGVHQPTSLYELVEQVNDPFATRRMDTFYGVIGIEGNPELHPYANIDAVGQSCEAASDCGAHPNGNVCVDGSCAAKTLTEAACPSGTQYGVLGEGDRAESGVCY